MTVVRMWFLINILRTNGQNLTKFYILSITDKIFVGIVIHHQFFQTELCHCISLSSESAMAGL